MNRRGFSLVELLTTIAVIGLLASIAMPKYQQFRKRAYAAEIVAAMTTIRAGIYQFNETAGTWPGTSALGAVPTGMGAYLPGGGTKLFNGNYHKMGWIALGIGSTSLQIMYASITDGTVCTSTYGLMGGAGNSSLLGLCGASGGFVFLWVDQ